MLFAVYNKNHVNYTRRFHPRPGLRHPLGLLPVCSRPLEMDPNRSGPARPGHLVIYLNRTNQRTEHADSLKFVKLRFQFV